VKTTPESAEAANVFFVRDNGRGIGREFHEEIFRIFKRLQNTQDTEEGTGVGLTFVKKIVERHGGRIWLESNRVWAPPSISRSKENTMTQNVAPKSLREMQPILIVDDSIDDSRRPSAPSPRPISPTP